MFTKSEKGFSGIDVIISIIVITIFITMIGNLIVNINLTSKDIERKTIATSYAIQEIEKIKSEGITNYTNKGIDTEYVVEKDINKDKEFTGYHKKITVKDYVLISKDNTKEQDKVKEVTVEISYKIGNKEKNVSISTYITSRKEQDMRNNKGVTLTSVIIYIIGMTLVMATIATLTSFFYKNINIEEISDDSATQYTKFSSIFTEEINRENNRVVDSKILMDEEEKIKESYIIFSSGNQYTFKKENQSIYKNNIKICENIEACDFSYTFVDFKYKIKVNFKTKNIDMTGDNAVTYNM